MLELAKGAGTSMVSLTVAANGQLPNKLLTEEFSKASNIKSRVNRHSVESAIKSCIERVKMFKKVPPNGLCVFCGETVLTDGKSKQLAVTFEPHKPLSENMYMCDNKFHLGPLRKLLEGGHKFGFIVMDGHGCLCGTVCGSEKLIKSEFTVDLPKKHNRGGQSKERFARRRLEACHNFVTKAALLATNAFITSDVPNVKTIILAGAANYKNELFTMLDQRLQKIVHPVFWDIQYAGAAGFDEAIGLSKDIIGDITLVHEKAVVTSFMQKVVTINASGCLACYGKKDVDETVRSGQADTVLVWDNWKDEYLNWLMENRVQLGITVELVSDKTSEGMQFCKGFGGIGAILRYPKQVIDDDSTYEVVDDIETIV